MPQMLLITAKYVLIVGSFKIYEIEVFVDISISNFNNAHPPRGLPGGHWQHIVLVLQARKQPIDTKNICLNMEIGR